MESIKKELPLVRPVFRKAVIMNIEPEPNEQSAQDYAEAIKNFYDENINEYLKCLAKASKLNFSKLIRDESKYTKVIKEENAFVVYCPSIHSTNDNTLNFDSRLSIAICSKGKKAKIWVKASIYNGKDYTGSIKLNNVNILNLLKRIISECSNWSFKKLNELLCNKFPGTNITHAGYLDIDTLGSNEKVLNNILNNLDSKNGNSHKLFEYPNSLNIIKKYYKLLIPNLNGNIEKILKNEPDDTFWTHLPLHLEDNEGYIKYRDVLYLNTPDRSDESTIKSVGIGFDDSKSGILSLLSSIHMVRWYGKQV